MINRFRVSEGWLLVLGNVCVGLRVWFIDKSLLFLDSGFIRTKTKCYKANIYYRK